MKNLKLNKKSNKKLKRIHVKKEDLVILNDLDPFTQGRCARPYRRLKRIKCPFCKRNSVIINGRCQLCSRPID